MTLATYLDVDPQAAEQSPSIIERRRAGRVEEAWAVAVYDPCASRFFVGKTVDVSTTGLKVRLPGWVQLPQGRVIDLHAAAAVPASTLGRHRVMLCRVIWTAAAAADSQFSDSQSAGEMLVGVEFLPAARAVAA